MTTPNAAMPPQEPRKEGLPIPAPNVDQQKSLARSVLQVGGGAAIGFGIARGWISPDKLQACMQTSADNLVGCLANLPESFAGAVSNEALAGYAAAGIAIVWGMVTHTRTNTIAAAHRLPQVAGVLLHPDHPESQDVMKDIVSPKLAIAGSVFAKEIAEGPRRGPAPFNLGPTETPRRGPASP